MAILDLICLLHLVEINQSNNMNNLISQLQLNPTFQKYKYFILPVVSVLVCILLSIAVIVPQVFEIFNSAKVITQAKEEYDFFSNKINILENVKVAEYKNDINTSLIALPPDQDVTGVLDQVIYLIGANNLRIENIMVVNFNASAASAPKAGAPNAFQIRVTVSGDETDLRNFISAINQLPRIMKISELRLSGSRTGGAIQAEISLTTYYQSLPTTIGDINQEVSPISEADQNILGTIQNNAKAVPGSISQVSSGATGAKGKADPFN